MTSTNCKLQIRDVELNVNLGWRKKERSQEQRVLLTIDICFPKPPIACSTDKLADTICYATLIQRIREQLGEKHFHLVEHLAHDIYQIVKPLMLDKTKIIVSITKYPEVEGLTGGVCFSYSDE